MNARIAEHAEDVKMICREYGLEIPFVTIIAHDPAKPELYTIVSEETDQQLADTANLLRRNAHAFVLNQDTLELPTCFFCCKPDCGNECMESEVAG